MYVYTIVYRSVKHGRTINRIITCCYNECNDFHNTRCIILGRSNMTKMVPNDKNERLKFLKEIYNRRNTNKNESPKMKNRRLEKEYLLIKKLQNARELPPIEIPLMKRTKEWGDLVFRIDKDEGTIRIFQRVYQWDSDKDDIDDE